MIDARSANAPRLPLPLRAIASRLPRRPVSAAFARALDLTLRRKFPAEVLEHLEGHAFVVAVEDAGLELALRVVGGRFRRVPPGMKPSLRFRAVAWDYAALAAREADPDTLFFNRRLVVEGETELALWVKNTLDTIDIPRTRGFIRRVMRVVGPRAA